MTTSLAACRKQRNQKRSFAGSLTTLLITAAFMTRSGLWATAVALAASTALTIVTPFAALTGPPHLRLWEVAMLKWLPSRARLVREVLRRGIRAD